MCATVCSCSPVGSGWDPLSQHAEIATMGSTPSCPVSSGDASAWMRCSWSKLMNACSGRSCRLARMPRFFASEVRYDIRSRRVAGRASTSHTLSGDEYRLAASARACTTASTSRSARASATAARIFFVSNLDAFCNSCWTWWWRWRGVCAILTLAGAAAGDTIAAPDAFEG